MSNTITVIIPVHELTEVTTPLFVKALESVTKQTVKPEKFMVIGPKEALDKALEASLKVDTKGIEGSFIEKFDETDFASQMNAAVNVVDTTHFLFLEADDTLTEIWVKNAKEYIAAYPEVSTFLPVVLNLDAEGKVLGLTNEPVWANEFSDKLGELDTETLLRYNDFNFDGMVMSVEAYKEVGGLKPSLKMVFPLEFLLRVTELDHRVMVVPKIGYNHIIQREGSLFQTLKSTLSIDEQRWWLALAKKEYFHIKDRKVAYERED